MCCIVNKLECNVSVKLGDSFSYYYRSKSSFLGKIFQKNDAQVTGFEGLSHF